MASVLFVCRANLCRSPMAEQLTRHALASRSGAASILVASAGTHAVPGEPMHPAARRALAGVGADAGGFASRLLSADLVGTADLVLAATREQRARCASLVPAALGRTFTIRQFARLAAAVGPGPVPGTDAGHRLAVLVGEAARIRGQLQPVPAAQDDVADPLRGRPGDIRACLHEIHAALRPFLDLICST